VFATDDAPVKESDPDTNYGGDQNVFLGLEANNAILFLKFNVPLNTTGQKYTKAELVFIRRNNDQNFTQGVGLEICIVNNDTWSENEITWNNMPTIGNSIANITSHEKEPLYKIDVTSYLNGKQIISFAIRNTTNNGEYVKLCMKECQEPGGNESIYLLFTYGNEQCISVSVDKASYRPGDSINITWFCDVPLSSVDIKLIDASGDLVVIIKDRQPCSGEFLWTIPSGNYPSSYYRIKIIDSATGNYYGLSSSFVIESASIPKAISGYPFILLGIVVISTSFIISRKMKRK